MIVKFSGALGTRRHSFCGCWPAKTTLQSGDDLPASSPDIRLAYSVSGSGVPVRFIQEVGVQGGGWRPQTDDLADGYSSLWFDNRGMGRSQPIGAEVTVAQMADDARAVLAAAGGYEPIPRTAKARFTPTLNAYSFPEQVNANLTDPSHGIDLFGVCDFWISPAPFSPVIRKRRRTLTSIAEEVTAG